MSTKLNISRSRQFIIFLSLFIVGVLVASFIAIRVTYLFLLPIVILFVIALILKNKILIIISVCVGCLMCGVWYLNFYKAQRIYSFPYDKQIKLTGEIVDEPDVRETKNKLVILIKTVFDDSAEYQSLLNKKILVDACRYPEYYYGDLVEVQGKLIKPEIIDSFDYGAYLRLKNIGATIQTCNSYSKNTSIALISHARDFSIYSLIYRVKNSLINKLNLLFPEPGAGLLNGILFGTKKAVIGNFNDNLNITGLTHVIVVSGYHVVILTQIFIILTKKWPKKLSFFAGTLFLFFFSVFVGMGASVIRSVIMAWLMLLAKILGRKATAINIIVLTCFLMIVQNPLIVKDDIGFQLSFLSFIGIAYVGPALLVYFKKFGDSLAEIVSSTLGAQIMTTPLIAIYFARISLIAPLTNILIVPIIPLIMLGSFTAIILSYINYYLAFVFSWTVRLPVDYMIFIVNYFANFRFSSLLIQINYFWLIIYYLLLIIILIIKKHYETKN